MHYWTALWDTLCTAARQLLQKVDLDLEELMQFKFSPAQTRTIFQTLCHMDNRPPIEFTILSDQEETRNSGFTIGLTFHGDATLRVLLTAYYHYNKERTASDANSDAMMLWLITRHHYCHSTTRPQSQ